MPGSGDGIKLSQIRLVSEFCCEEDTRLTTYIEKYGLDNPLIIEGPIDDDDHYDLIVGYRTYESLVHLGRETVKCTIEPVSDLAHRIAKRLRRDNNKHRMRSLECIRHVHRLLNMHWSEDLISKETGIARAVICKYKRIRDIPQEYKDIIKSLELGNEALLALDSMQRRIPSRIFYQIVDVLTKKRSEIFGYHVVAIEYLTKASGFCGLQETAVNHSVRKTIIHKTFKQKEAQKIVDIEAVVSGITKDDVIIGQCVDSVIYEANELARILSPNLMKHVTLLQRKQLVEIFKKCLGKAE